MFDAFGVSGLFRRAAEKTDGESIGSFYRKQFSSRRIGFQPYSAIADEHGGF